MTCYSDVCARWVENVLNGHQKKILKTERVFPGTWGEERDRIFSYGRHFEMARVLRNRKGEPTHFLVNGDTFSHSTTGHQGHVRSAIAGSGLPSVIIPHSVLNSAGVLPDSVQIIDVLPDRHVEYTRTYTEIQPGWQWRDDEEYHYRPQNAEEQAASVARAHRKAVKEWEDRNDMVWREIERSGLFNIWLGRYSTHDPFPPRPKPFEDLNYWQYQQEVKVTHGYTRNLYASHTRYAPRVDVHIDDDGTTWYSLTRTRHVLGEALVRCTIEFLVPVTCKDCGGTGTRPHVPEPNGYYLSEIAKYEAETSEGWRHYVKTKREDLERDLQHQLACPSCTSNGGRFTGRPWRGSGRRHERRRRRPLFLSGFDHQEPRISYFFSELPNTKPRTVEEAYEALKPDTVKMAEQMGREVLRQGDIFAIPMPDLTKRELTKMGATHQRRGVLLGTNHVATEVAYLPDGRTFARGILRHDPDFRRPDHVMVRLHPKQWHLILKNTVPVSA
jgi:hypothetical protein